ncbi:type IV pilus assembly protein FimV [Metabacillus arenae]|uniref:LysM domain-containing protein n=1 Tax=Metabacillus arenae TaxID=2771434 RepID=A0A926NJB6_9BACI|nr:hypothetical protein [Metabacillus arenae]MBD1378906.1 hypothetical protein [Metabacillus arenae]
MKRLFILCLSLFICYIVYYDIQKGTLPRPAQPNQIEEPSKPAMAQTDAPDFVERKVRAGETVLSILEDIHQSSLPISIEEMIQDFEEINPEEKAENIVIGESYKFPLYKEDESQR